MANFSVLASQETIEKGRELLEAFKTEGKEKQEETLLRIFAAAEKQLTRGTHPELERHLDGIDSTIDTLIKQINGVVAGNDLTIKKLKESLDAAIESKNKVLSESHERVEALKDREAALTAKEAELEARVRQMQESLDLANEVAKTKSDANDILMRQAADQAADLEKYKQLKVDYAALEQRYNDLRVVAKEMEMKVEIEVQKARMEMLQSIQK